MEPPGFAGCYFLCSSEWEPLVVNCLPGVSGPAGKKAEMSSCPQRDVPERSVTHTSLCSCSAHGKTPTMKGPGVTCPGVLPSALTEDQKLQERCL